MEYSGKSRPGIYARVAQRFQVRWLVRLESGSGMTRDISASGIYFESEMPFGAGDAIQFAVMLPAEDGIAEKLECEGRAVRVELLSNGLYGVGVALMGLDFINLHSIPGLNG